MSDIAEYDSLSLESLEFLVERIRQMRRKEILEKHKPKIKQLPSGKYYTRLNGRLIQRVNKKDLEDVIIKAYDNECDTINSIFEEYLLRRKMEVADTTWVKDVQLYRDFIKSSELASMPLNNIRLKDGYHFLEYCLGVKSDMTRKYWANLSGCLNNIFQYCIDSEYIRGNPFTNLKVKRDIFAAPKITRDGDTVFSKAEQHDVCTLAEEDAVVTGRSEPLGIPLLFNLGLRDGELCTLKWGDIEPSHRGLFIHIQREMVTNITPERKSDGFAVLEHCKTPAGDRRLLLNKKAKELLEIIKRMNIANDLPCSNADFIFLRKGCKNCTPRSFDPRLRKYCKKAGMAVIKSPHDIRRTVLTNLYMAHMPLKKIQEYAGHSSLKQTLDYLRVTDDDINLMEYLDTLSDTTEPKILDFPSKIKKVNIGEQII